MPPDTTQQNSEILRRLEALEIWKKDREEQQITFPLDQGSLDILNRHYLHVVAAYPYAGGAAGRQFVTFIAQQDYNPVREITDSNGVAWGYTFSKFQLPQANILPYSANPGNDRIILHDDIDIDSGISVLFYTNGVAPGGITAGLGTPAYKVNNLRDRSFEIQDTNGATVNITNAGEGKQFLVITDSNGVPVFGINSLF